MRLVRTVIRRQTNNGKSTLHLDVEMTPLGGVVFGIFVAWTGYKAFKALRKRLWLPIGTGIAMLALRYLSRSREECRSYQEEE
ncbi:MAG: hypothetical protein ACUVTY_04430 [Armatimonadota bacterium]